MSAALPSPILTEVFSYLDIRDLGKIVGVCKKWKEISVSDELWKPFYSRLYATEKFPSDLHFIVIEKIKQDLLLIKRISLIPKKLPDYWSKYVSSEMAKIPVWERFKDDPLVFDSIHLDSVKGMNDFFALVTKVFEIYLSLSQIGYTTLLQAETLALKTKETFRNPHPFQVLAKKYRDSGDHEKSDEMELIGAILAMSSLKL